MFSYSVRRATCSTQSSSISVSLKTTVPRSQALSYRRLHQRRCSSSKPSSPPDGSKGVSEGQQVPSAPAQTRPEGDKKSVARASRRKAKDVTGDCVVKARDETMQNLPTVPNTHHIKDKEIAASAFFSLHRPISVTSSFPKIVTDGVFAAIFSPWKKSNIKSADVTSTLLKTPYKLGSSTRPESWNSDGDELGVTITTEANQVVEGNVKHLDQSASVSYIPFPQHILSGQYQPFNTPPPPWPRNKMESPAVHAGIPAESVAKQYRTYTAVITIEESTDANGEVTWTARSTPLVAKGQDQAPPPTTSRGRRNIRQQHFEESQEQKAEETGIWAISVKRQRKLKMKKHKYKKLMRRTRNLRRRLDRN